MMEKMTGKTQVENAMGNIVANVTEENAVVEVKRDITEEIVTTAVLGYGREYDHLAVLH